MRKFLITGAIMALGLALLPSTAPAHTCCKRSLTVFGSPATGPPYAKLSYKVRSVLPRCRAGIRVRLFRNASLYRTRARTGSDTRR